MKPPTALRRVAMVILAFATSLSFYSRTQAHDHWINRGDYSDPVYGWRCCGDTDCLPIPMDKLKATAVGWLLPDGAIIPYARGIPTLDGLAYTCRWGSEQMGTGNPYRCLFVEEPGS